jgi:hypothetical protein
MTMTDCYNTGPIRSKSRSPTAGGIAGQSYGGTIILANCYNAGRVEAIQLSSTIPNAGGILAYGGIGTIRLVNCYFVEGQTFKDAVLSDLLCGNLTDGNTFDGNSAAVPGNSDPIRTTDPDQHSGAKASGDMKPALVRAIEGDTLFYTGDTTLASGTVTGWDFFDTWVVIDGINEGYPVLKAFYPPDPPGPKVFDDTSGKRDWWIIIPFILELVLLAIGRWWFIAAKRRKEEEEES